MKLQYAAALVVFTTEEETELARYTSKPKSAILSKVVSGGREDLPFVSTCKESKGVKKRKDFSRKSCSSNRDENRTRVVASGKRARRAVAGMATTLATALLEEGVPRPVSARVHALRGVIRLPEDFDEREFKSERLASRFGV